jgi:hypothetical protein
MRCYLTTQAGKSRLFQCPIVGPTLHPNGSKTLVRKTQGRPRRRAAQDPGERAAARDIDFRREVAA